MNAQPPEVEGSKCRSIDGEDFVYRNGKWNQIPYEPILQNMPLRDYFAGQALIAWVGTYSPFDKSYAPEAAEMAYRLADAMIAARATKPGGQ